MNTDCSTIIKFFRVNGGIPFYGVGFAGNIMRVINILLCGYDKVRVDTTNNKTICCNGYDDNSWDNFFNQKYEHQDKAKIINGEVDCGSRLYYKKNYKHNDDIILKAKKLFFSNFTINQNIIDKVDEFYLNNMVNKTTLGVQVRLGDMQKNHNTANVVIYEKRINDILNKHKDIEQIFLATDDDIAVNHLTSKIKIPIIYQKNIYRDSSSNPYRRISDERENHNYRLCEEVLMDILLLGKCEYFIRAHVSSVSNVSIILSDNIKETYNLL
jgi:hypothetical protein